MFALYIHWPFCASKCPYCDFNSHVAEAIDHHAWCAAYIREMQYYAALTQGRTVTSVFFGGGTPSLMQPETVRAVIEEAGTLWGFADDCEITLEANPTSVEIDKFKAFHAAGINRVSIGIQSLDDAQLAFLGRRHSAKEGLLALEAAASVFERYSFDLIYARPEQSADAWRAELTQALSCAGDHLSLYQLTIEPGTAFHTYHQRGDFSVPAQDDAGALYELTQSVMNDHGLPAYEISNHARPGQESRHNLTYWRYGDYAGIGPGAHGRLTLAGEKKATRAHRAPDIWLERVNQNGHGAHPFETIDAHQRFEEALMMGLRLRTGVLLAGLSCELGRPWHEVIPPGRIESMRDEGMVQLTDTHLIATPEGMQRLNGLLSYLLS